MGHNSTKETYQVIYFDWYLGVPNIDHNITWKGLQEYTKRIDNGSITVLSVNKDRIYN